MLRYLILSLALVLNINAALPSLVSSNDFRNFTNAQSIINGTQIGRITNAWDEANVIAFGADKTGVTNSTAAFVSLYAAGFRTALVPEGTYKVNLAVSGTNGIRGVSRRGVTFKPYTNTLPVITVLNTVSGVRDFGTYSDFVVDGSSLSGQIGIQCGTNGAGLTGNARNRYSNITIRNCPSKGLSIDDSTSCYYDNIYIEDCTNYGLYIDNERNVQLNTFINCQFRTCRVGAYFGSGNRNTFIGCDFESNDYTGAHIRRGSSSGLANSTFISCWWENNGRIAPATFAVTNSSIYFETASTVETTHRANLKFITCYIGSATNAFDFYASSINGVDFDMCSFTTSTNNGTGAGFTTNKMAYLTTSTNVFVNINQPCDGLNNIATPTTFASFPPLSTSVASTLGNIGITYRNVWQGREFSNIRQLGTNAVPVMTPAKDGEVITDTASGNRYISDGITGWIKIPKNYTATATLDFGSINAAASADLTITVTGATTGSPVSLSLPTAPTAGIIFNSFVSAADTVTIRASNITAAPVDPASASYTVQVFKQ